MIRMEIALILILAFVAGIYFSARRRQTALHKTFSALLIVVIVHLMFDAATIYTVNHLDRVPSVLNDILHRLFVGTMALVLFFFYQYIAILVEEETGKKRTLDLPARIFLVISEVGAMILPITYTETPDGNYSAGLYAYVSYVSVAVYLILCSWLLLANWKKMDNKKKFAIGMALIFEFTICFLQGLHHTWLISGMGITLMTLAFYLTLENPDALRAELTEQKMSMLYLKSQVNPHFLYNTLSMMNWMAIRSNQMEISKVTLALSTFYRTALSKGEDVVTVENCIQNMEAYLEIQLTMHDHNFSVDWDIDPTIKNEKMPKLLLQPVVENAIEHGLDEKEDGDKKIFLSFKGKGDDVEITVRDNGLGMEQEKAETLVTYQAKGYGLKNVNDRIRLLYGENYGIHIFSSPDEGTTVIMKFPKEGRENEE